MRWFRLLLLALLIPLAGCALNARPSTYLVEVKGPYALDTGDVVRVTVYGEPEVTKSYRVDDGGAISLPLVGSINVRGQTTQMAAATVTAALADGYIREPAVLYPGRGQERGAVSLRLRDDDTCGDLDRGRVQRHR